MYGASACGYAHAAVRSSAVPCRPAVHHVLQEFDVLLSTYDVRFCYPKRVLPPADRRRPADLHTAAPTQAGLKQQLHAELKLQRDVTVWPTLLLQTILAAATRNPRRYHRLNLLPSTARCSSILEAACCHLHGPHVPLISLSPSQNRRCETVLGEFPRPNGGPMTTQRRPSSKQLLQPSAPVRRCSITECPPTSALRSPQQRACRVERLDPLHVTQSLPACGRLWRLYDTGEGHHPPAHTRGRRL